MQWQNNGDRRILDENYFPLPKISLGNNNFKHMIPNKATLNLWIDKALKPYGVTIAQIEKEEGEVIKDKKLRKKGKSPYYITYPFKNEEHYDIWKEFIIKELKKLEPDKDDEKIGMEFDFIDALIGLSQPYLFNEKNAINGKEL